MFVFNKWLVGLVGILIFNLSQGQSVNTACPIVSKSVSIDGGLIAYLQGGKGPPVLLLHGLFGQKEQWTELACGLANQGFNVIAPDLPGYGLSTAYPISAYPLESQVKILQQFMNSVSGKPFHIAGNSMGGAIAGLYANQYPQEIKSLAFIGAPLGLVAWGDDVKSAIFQGVNPFIPVNAEQFDLEMRLLFSQPPVLDESIKLQLLSEYRNNNRHYQQVWDIVNFYGDSLNQLPKQSLRTLALWGDRDAIFSIAGLQVLKEKFPHSQVHRFSGAGHLLMLEEPQKIIDLYRPFLINTK
jgi:abhydrolase domain-containing protein 6